MQGNDIHYSLNQKRNYQCHEYRFINDLLFLELFTRRVDREENILMVLRISDNEIQQIKIFEDNFSYFFHSNVIDLMNGSVAIITDKKIDIFNGSEIDRTIEIDDKIRCATAIPKGLVTVNCKSEIKIYPFLI